MVEQSKNIRMAWFGFMVLFCSLLFTLLLVSGSARTLLTKSLFVSGRLFRDNKNYKSNDLLPNEIEFHQCALKIIIARSQFYGKTNQRKLISHLRWSNRNSTQHLFIEHINLSQTILHFLFKAICACICLHSF